jgi:hypothetical protein
MDIIETPVQISIGSLLKGFDLIIAMFLMHPVSLREQLCIVAGLVFIMVLSIMAVWLQTCFTRDLIAGSETGWI